MCVCNIYIINTIGNNEVIGGLGIYRMWIYISRIRLGTCEYARRYTYHRVHVDVHACVCHTLYAYVLTYHQILGNILEHCHVTKHGCGSEREEPCVEECFSQRVGEL